MGTPWEPEPPEESWSDRDAWRGEQHADDVDGWRQESSNGWTWPMVSQRNAEAEPESDWPEGLAGPEYWLFKRDSDQK